MNSSVAVIGCGHWGKNLIRNFDELGALAAVCDPDTQLAQSYADKYSVGNLSFNEILASQSINGVVLAVPASLHASMAIEAMNAGKHVYVEKPLAMNRDEADAMIISAKKNEVQLMVGHLLKYHPAFIALHQLVESRELGTLSYLYSNRLSFGKIRSEEDVIWSFAPHDISMLLSLTGKDPKVVRTNSSRILQHNIADTALIHLEFPEGLNGHIAVSWLHPFKEHKLVVVGKTGMAVFDDTKPWSEKLSIYRHNIKFNSDVPLIEKGEVEYLNVPYSEPLRNECSHFLDVLKGGVVPLTGGEEGLRVLNVLCAASLSEKMSKPVML